MPSSGYKKEVFTVYSPELSVWLYQNKLDYHRPPEHNHECTAKFAEEGPKILSPSEDYDYYIEKNLGQEMLLLAGSDSRVRTQYWYINDKFYKKCRPGERIFFSPDTKELKITCLDDKGRDGSVNVNVKYY